ncbi:MAG: TonB-dependent receptor [Bacteroidales bacterium]|nr:TonB-dependent receptor [Bacteroidales bacterium]
MTSFSQNTYKKLFCIFWFLVFHSISTYAQRPQGSGNGQGGNFNLPEGKALLVGKIVDSKTQSPLQFTSISIFSDKDKKLVSGGISDENGRFKIEVDYGQYFITIDFMGYQQFKSKVVVVSKENPIGKLNKIQIEQNTDVLGEVEIKAEKQMFENKIDSKTFNVSKDITMQSKSALEALEQIPSVSVDIDGNISLRGNGNIKILIDDRPIVVSAENQADLLEQIQADNIESIDIITNPSAKYDPEGMGGIINIKLKKSQPNGKNLNVTVSSDFIREHGVNVSGGVRTKKVNVYGTYGFKYNKFNYERESHQSYLFGDTVYYLDQHSEGGRSNLNHMGTAGFDYQINSKNSIGIETLISAGNKDKANPYTYKFRNENKDLVSSSYRDNTNLNEQYKFDVQLRYKHKFEKPRQTLDLNLSRVQNFRDDRSDFFETTRYPTIGDTLDIEKNNERQASEIYNYTLNHFYPLKGSQSIEMGLDGRMQFINNSIDVLGYDFTNQGFISDPFLSSQFDYFDQYHSVYGLYKNTISKLDFQLGLRLEYSQYQFNLPENQNTTSSRELLNYYPSAHLLYHWNDDTEIGASYSKRVNRPDIRELNPIHDYSDAYNYRVGNPNLNPENIHSTEINFSKRWSNLRFMPALYYKYISDVIKRIKTMDSSGISVVSFENLDYGSSYGTEIIVAYKPVKWLDVNASGNLGYSILKDKTDESLSNESFEWSSKLNAFIILPFEFKLQISYQYRGKSVTPQGYIEPMYWVDFGLRKNFWKDKATFSLRASDVLRTRAFKIHAEDINYTTDLRFQRYHAFIVASFSYQIGANERKKNRERESDGGEDMGL